MSTIGTARKACGAPVLFTISAICSGLMKPDTNIGGKIAAVSEVFNEETTSIFLNRIQT